ncbi:MAG: helix-turn-helix domain-containing protein [Eubacterium sp.]|nr:helix-turn-helix domain-containing protein [Eubacterium sp.]
MDKYKLEYEMKSRGITIEKLCAEIHISRSAFYRKCNGISEFTQGEIQNIVDYIGLDSPMGIFFTEKVSDKTQQSVIG